MFCPSCSRETLGDATFCPGCGKRLPSAASGVPPLDSPLSAPPLAAPTPAPKRVGKSLWHLHVSDWWGECPACKEVNTADTSRCPNDGSPMVAAFHASKRDPMAFPIHTVHLRCGANCGYVAGGFPCNNDGTFLTSANLKFRMGLVRTVLHNLYWTSYFLMTWLLVAGGVAATVYAFKVWIIPVYYYEEIDKTARYVLSAFFLAVSLVLIVPYFLITACLFQYCSLAWWPYRRQFDFEEATRAAMLQQAAKSGGA